MGICTILQKNNWRLSQYLAIVINEYTWNLDSKYSHAILDVFRVFLNQLFLLLFRIYCFILVWPWVVIRKHKQINQHHIKNINFDDIRKMSNVVEYEIINKSFENFLSKVLIVL